MDLVRASATGLAILSIGGCGVVHAGSNSPSPTPPAITSPHAGFDVLITENDRAALVRVGQRIELALRAKPGMSDWSGVTVDDGTVLRAVPTGITAARGVTIAGYEAARTGTVTITATATPLCSPGQACPAIAMLFEVRVTVT